MGSLVLIPVVRFETEVAAWIWVICLRNADTGSEQPSQRGFGMF
jgi:hypothetical protein